MRYRFNYLITLLFIADIFPGQLSSVTAHFQESGGENVARTEEGGEKDPGDVG